MAKGIKLTNHARTRASTSVCVCILSICPKINIEILPAGQMGTSQVTPPSVRSPKCMAICPKLWMTIPLHPLSLVGNPPKRPKCPTCAMEEHAWQFCCEAGHLHTLIYGAFSKNNGIQNHWILEVPHFLSNLKTVFRLPFWVASDRTNQPTNWPRDILDCISDYNQQPMKIHKTVFKEKKRSTDFAFSLCECFCYLDKTTGC